MPEGRPDFTRAPEDDGAGDLPAPPVKVDLGSSSELFRVLFDLSPDAVLFYVRGIVEHANPAALRLLGAERLDQLVGRRSTSIIHPESIPRVEQRVAALLGGAASVPAAEERYVRLDGTILDVESNAALVPMGDVKAFIVIVRDIRERKEAEAQRRRARGAGGEPGLEGPRAVAPRDPRSDPGLHLRA